MIPAFEHHPNCCFLGFPMSQNRYAIPAWSYLLEKVRPSSIVEIGTSEGGMSCLLALAARQLQASFDTFDVGQTLNKEVAETLSMLCGPAEGFHRCDVFGDQAKAIITYRMGRIGKTVFLCDGGNKEKEFATFAPLLQPGDVIGVHDARGRSSWPWQEFSPESVQEFMLAWNLEEFMRDVFIDTGWFVCRKKATTP